MMPAEFNTFAHMVLVLEAWMNQDRGSHNVLLTVSENFWGQAKYASDEFLYRVPYRAVPKAVKIFLHFQ